LSCPTRICPLQVYSEGVTPEVAAMWNGTKNLITRSKIGHMPRLMLRVVYKPGENFFIGDLQNRISLNFDVEEEKIRSIKDFSIKLDELIDELANYGDKIEKLCLLRIRI